MSASRALAAKIARDTSVTDELTNAQWKKSTYSQPSGECVEIAFLDSGRIGVRDSKNPTGPALVFAPSEWDAFTSAVEEGEFDRP